MHWAAYKGYADTVRLLLVMNARMSLPDKEGCTPLHWGAIRGNGEACTLLLQVGALDTLLRDEAPLTHKPLVRQPARWVASGPTSLRCSWAVVAAAGVAQGQALVLAYHPCHVASASLPRSWRAEL